MSTYTRCLVNPAVRYIPLKAQDYLSWLLKARSHYIMPSYSNMNRDNSTIITVLQFCIYHNIQATHVSPTLASVHLTRTGGGQYRVRNFCIYYRVFNLKVDR